MLQMRSWLTVKRCDSTEGKLGELHVGFLDVKSDFNSFQIVACSLKVISSFFSHAVVLSSGSTFLGRTPFTSGLVFE